MRYIVPGEMSLHGYAVDHAIKLSFSADDRSAETITLKDMEHCVGEIKLWMDSNRQKMNSSKT